MNKNSNKNDLLSLKNKITSLTNEVNVARIDIANGKQVDLNEFQEKVSIFCNSLNINPPPETEAPKVLASIEILLSKINDLQNELSDIDVSTLEESIDIKKNRDLA